MDRLVGADEGLMGVLADHVHVSTRPLVGPHDVQEHVYREAGSNRTITLQSQRCLLCDGCGKVDLVPTVHNGDPVYAVHAGSGGKCVVCSGSGRMPTKRALRKALQSAQRRATNAKQDAELAAAQVAAAGRGEPLHAWVIPPGPAAEALGAPPGKSMVAMPGDHTAVARAKQAGGDLVWMEAANPEMVLQFKQMQRQAEDDWAEAQATVEWFEDQLHMLATVVSAYGASQREKAAAASAAAVVVAEQRHDPAKVCNGYEQVKGKRKRCHRAPKEWDARGHGWCRRHAHSRGLHKQGEASDAGT